MVTLVAAIVEITVPEVYGSHGEVSLILYCNESTQPTPPEPVVMVAARVVPRHTVETLGVLTFKAGATGCGTITKSTLERHPGIIEHWV
jgi:hypothetical protein